MSPRVRHALIALLFLIGGLGVLAYAGPGRAVVRGSLGDVLVVPFLVHLLGVVVPTRAGWRIAIVGGIALGTELLQLLNLVAPDAPAWLHLTVGSTFDPWDLLGYTVGLAIALGIAWGLSRWDAARPSAPGEGSATLRHDP